MINSNIKKSKGQTDTTSLFSIYILHLNFIHIRLYNKYTQF